MTNSNVSEIKGFATGFYDPWLSLLSESEFPGFAGSDPFKTEKHLSSFLQKISQMLAESIWLCKKDYLIFLIVYIDAVYFGAKM